MIVYKISEMPMDIEKGDGQRLEKSLLTGCGVEKSSESVVEKKLRLSVVRQRDRKEL